MSSQDLKDTFTASIEEYKIFNNFVNKSQEQGHNFSFKSNPNTIYSKGDKLEEKNEKYDFYKKYNVLVDLNVAQPFYLEEELARQVKFWHSTNEKFNLPILTLDNFFNEENVKSHLLKETYIKKNPPITTFYLIDYIISILETKAFEKILIQGITTYQEEKDQIGLIGPVIDRDFIYHLISNDIEEKLNYLYKENSLGYSYIAEKIISFDLFIIYLVLKNYPFYILRRERLEEIFNKLKKFKSFPYPIGSIGMDLFKLLIRELYLPGVSLFQEIRETFMLDSIDPKIYEINCDYFIKVIAFSINGTIYGMNCEANNKNNINDDFINNQDNVKGKNKNNKKVKINSKNETLKLNESKNFTFTAYGVYSAFILYSSDDQKEEKENSYLVDILSLFEKRYKAKKEEEEENEKDKKKEKIEKDEKKEINISEKNIINNIFNLIDTGLDSSYALFSHDVKVINDKLISKTKEIHESTSNYPRDNINLRRFLEHKISFLPLESLQQNIKRFSQEELHRNITKKKLAKKKLNKFKENNNDIINKSNKGSNINNINNINNEENEMDEEDEKIWNIKEKRALFDDKNYYKIILEEEKKVNSDIVLENYVKNYMNLKEKYFWHLKQFDMSLTFNSEELKKNVQKFNIIAKIREEKLSELYKQKYLITEDQFIIFMKSLFTWKSNINPLYHKKLYEEFIKNREEQKHDKKNKKNSLIKDFDIFEDDCPENDKELAKIPLNEIKKIKEELETIVKSKLYFNYIIYLIPGLYNKSITKHISRNDYIYKNTIGDLFMNFYKTSPPSMKVAEEIIKTPIQIYLREAKHFYDLTVFKVAIEKDNTYDDNDNYMNLHLHSSYYLLYGGIHIETNGNNLQMILDGKTINFETQNQQTLFIDIVNIYNFDNNGDGINEKKKINDIERYLAYPISDKFQIFISNVKDSPNCNNMENENQNQYFQKYIGNLINFDVKSAYYESRKIIIKSSSFTLTPTCIENITFNKCRYFEISFDNIYNNVESDDEEEEEESEENIDKQNINDLTEITKILELGKTGSFNIKIATFIDLESDKD